MKNFLHKNFVVISASLLIVTAIVGIIYSYTQTTIIPKEVSANSPIVVIEPLEYDWGTIDDTNVVETLVDISNDGKLPLEILSIATSCGCTEAKLWFEGKEVGGSGVLAPGEKGKVRITFDPTVMDSSGDVVRAVRVETNDPKSPFVVINLIAYVE